MMQGLMQPFTVAVLLLFFISPACSAERKTERSLGESAEQSLDQIGLSEVTFHGTVANIVDRIGKRKRDPDLRVYTLVNIQGIAHSSIDVEACTGNCKGGVAPADLDAGIAIGMQVTVQGGLQEARGRRNAVVTAVKSVVRYVPDLTPPSTPEINYLFADSPTAITVRWTVSTDNENGSGLKEYRLYRDGQLVHTAAAGSTEFKNSIAGYFGDT